MPSTLPSACTAMQSSSTTRVLPANASTVMARPGRRKPCSASACSTCSDHERDHHPDGKVFCPDRPTLRSRSLDAGGAVGAGVPVVLYRAAGADPCGQLLGCERVRDDPGV